MDQLSTSPTKRRSMDLMKLMMSDYEVELVREDGTDFNVVFHGPKDTAYQGGIWKVHVGLPAEYPFCSPSIGFRNCMYHPNVDEMSGSVCLDVINQTWSPMFDLLNIFDVFLPQLLAYPNPADPLNSDAASLLLKDPKKYEIKVKQYVREHATEASGGLSSLSPQGNKSISSNSNSSSPCERTSNDSSPQQNSTCSTEASFDEQERMEEDDELSSLSDASDNGFDLDI